MFLSKLILCACRLALVAVPPFAPPIEEPRHADRVGPPAQRLVEPDDAQDRSTGPPRLTAGELKEIERIRQQIGSVLDAQDDDHAFRLELQNNFGEPAGEGSALPLPVASEAEVYRRRSLRSLSRRLEAISQDLEDLDLSRAAAETRDLGRQLRRQARGTSAINRDHDSTSSGVNQVNRTDR